MRRDWIIAAALLAAACAPPAPQQTQAPPLALDQRDAEAMAALERMSEYMGALTAYEVRAESDDDLPLAFVGSELYRVVRPHSFFVEAVNDGDVRRYYYDGAQLTLSLPRQNYYAITAAPATIEAAADQLDDMGGDAPPLAHLLHWSAANSPLDEVEGAVRVGYAEIGGVDTDQYAFRDDESDWRIWIARGDEPLPRRIVITPRDDPSRPRYAANLSWNTAPEFAAETFVFTPARGAREMEVAELGDER